MTVQMGSTPSESELISAHQTMQAHSGPGWNQAQGMGVSPHPAIGASVNYVQGLQGESRTQTFAHGASEGKSPSGDSHSIPGAGSILGKVKNIFTGGGGAAGDAAAGDAAVGAGEGLVADAALVAV